MEQIHMSISNCDDWTHSGTCRAARVMYYAEYERFYTTVQKNYNLHMSMEKTQEQEQLWTHHQ